jgi:hypothetical protein
VRRSARTKRTPPRVMWCRTRPEIAEGSNSYYPVPANVIDSWVLLWPD